MGLQLLIVSHSKFIFANHLALKTTERCSRALRGGAFCYSSCVTWAYYSCNELHQCSVVGTVCVQRKPFFRVL